MRPPHTCGRREDDNSDCKRAREGQNKKPAGLALGGVQEERGVRYFFAVRLRAGVVRGEFPDLECVALALALGAVSFDKTSLLATGCDTSSARTPNPPMEPARRRAPANAKAFMASACAPKQRRAAPTDSRSWRAG